MKRNLTISLIVLLILSGIRLFAQEAALIKENRPVSAFSAIKISGIAHVYLTKGNEEKVDVEVNNKEFNDRLIIEVVDKVLVIRMKQNEGGQRQNLGNVKVTINVAYKNLDKIQTSGVTHVYSQNTIKAPKLEIKTSGVSNAKLDIEAQEITIESSGTSVLNLTGNTQVLDIKSSGVSNIKAYELSAQEVRSEASGASNIYVAAAKTLAVRASGASNINYKGNPQITTNETSAASQIRKM